MTTFEFISALTLLCGPLCGLAIMRPQLLLHLFKPLLSACVLLATAALCWTLGVEHAHAALAPFIRPDANKEAALALASLGFSLQFHLLLTGFGLGLLLSFMLAQQVKPVQPGPGQQ